MHTETATIRLVPQVCGVWSYGVSISDASNALTNVDSDTYATITGSSGEACLSKFDYSQIPTGVTISSFYFRIKGESTSEDAGEASIYYCYNDSDFSIISDVYRFGSNAQVITMNSRVTNWTDLTQYQSNYSPHIRISPNGATLKIYGAELDVVYEYEAPDDHGIFNLILPRG